MKAAFQGCHLILAAVKEINTASNARTDFFKKAASKRLTGLSIFDRLQEAIECKDCQFVNGLLICHCIYGQVLWSVREMLTTVHELNSYLLHSLCLGLGKLS